MGKRKRPEKKGKQDDTEYSERKTKALKKESEDKSLNLRRSNRIAQAKSSQPKQIKKGVDLKKDNKKKTEGTKNNVVREEEATLIEGEMIYTNELKINERRLDSLARLLEGGSKSCTAITFINNKILIADNSIHGNTIIEEGKESIKIRLIKEVMYYYSQVARGKEGAALKEARENIFRLICTIRVKGEEKGYIKLEEDAINDIAIDILNNRATWRDRRVNDIIGKYPKVIRPFVFNTYGLIDLLVEDFVKIERFLRSAENKDEPLVIAFKNQELRYASTNERFGLLRESYNIFMDGNPGSIILRVDSDKVHAEVKVLVFLLLTGKIRRSEADYSQEEKEDKKLYIGISKLCCRYCIHFILALTKALDTDIITVEEGTEIEGRNQYSARLEEVESERLSELTKNNHKRSGHQIIFTRGYHNLPPDSWEKPSVIYDSIVPDSEEEEYIEQREPDEIKKDIYVDKEILSTIKDIFDPIYEDIKKKGKIRSKKNEPSKIIYQYNYADSSVSPTPGNSPSRRNNIIPENYAYYIEIGRALNQLRFQAKSEGLSPDILSMLEEIVKEAKELNKNKDFSEVGRQLDGGQLVELSRNMGLPVFTAGELRSTDNEPDMRAYISEVIKNYSLRREEYDTLSKEGEKAQEKFHHENPAYITIFEDQSLNILFRKAADKDYNNKPVKLSKFYENEKVKSFYEARARSMVEQAKKAQEQEDERMIKEIKSKEDEIKPYVIVSEHLERYTAEQDAIVMAMLNNNEFLERSGLSDREQSFYIIANRGNHHWVTVKIDLLGINQEGEREINVEIIDPAGGKVNKIECEGWEGLRVQDERLYESLKSLSESFQLKSYKYLSTNQQGTDEEGILSTCGIRAVFNTWYIIDQKILLTDLWLLAPSEEELRKVASTIINNQGMNDEINKAIEKWRGITSKDDAGQATSHIKKLDRDRKGKAIEKLEL